MVRFLFFLLFLNHFYSINCSAFSSTLGHIKPQAPLSDQANAVEQLIARIIPEKAHLFRVSINPDLSQDEALDAFKLVKTASDPELVIEATTGVAAANGFNYYLKYLCNCHISWEASQLNIPEELPLVNTTITLNDRFRYYQNVCTTSYSFVWWDWAQWEKHIDWIALNGFNLVLAFNGQEAIWERVYKKFNLTDEDINSHFSGPAFLSWLRMGNIRGWGGPLSRSWQERSFILQKQIVQRMRQFGIITVLPAFAGHLPRAFKKLYPDANMVQIGEWNGFNDTYCCPYFLDPTEELFNQIGKAFLSEQIAEFGTDHVYNCDSFNENTPSSGDLTYLFNVGQSIYKAMTDIDSNAIWLLQGWMFYYDSYWDDIERAKTFLTSIELGKMIVLDLQSEQFPQYDRFSQYFGQPYIWCMLHNFGGTLGMLGSSSIINQRPISARSSPGSTMIGIGVTPEGINQNYVIYDLMVENAWRKNATNLVEWVENYATRRYGIADGNANKAWSILINTVYNYSGVFKMRGKYVISRSPSLKISTMIWYAETELLTAWDYLLKASDHIGNNPAYYHDIVDITRQVLQVNGDTYYLNLLGAYKKKDIDAFLEQAITFSEIFTDLETILAADQAFLLGRWIDSAKKAANGCEEEKQFEYNAKNQISLWGPNGEIMDYANKQWSGVVSHLFAPRWQIFLNYVLNCLKTGDSYNQTFIKNKIFNDVEEPFTFDQTVFPTEPKGDPVEIAKRIHQKWMEKRFKSHKKLMVL